MSMFEERLGKDLRLLRNLERQNDRNRGSDLATKIREQTGKVDLEPLSGVDNFRQALLLRFLTPAGELRQLGHPNYGSNLFKLIGEPNTERNRNRAKMFVLQALQDEPRVEEVLAVHVTPNRARRTQIDIDVELLTINSDTSINLVFPFFLDGEIAL